VSCSHSNTSMFPPQAACERTSCKVSGLKHVKNALIFACLAHCIIAVDATAAAHPRPAPASEVRSGGASRRSTSVGKTRSGRAYWETLFPLYSKLRSVGSFQG
jgi:hypothetical protein